MPEPFKSLFNPDLISGMGEHLARHCPNFNRPGFEAACLHGLEALALKERSNQILLALIRFLPENFDQSAQILAATLHTNDNTDISDAHIDDEGIAGWAILPMTLYVAQRGRNRFDLSMTLLKEMSKRFSAEFAIRYFLISDPEKTLKVLSGWTKDNNRHIRRLVSEGTRPRLPWAMRLVDFVRDPTPIIPLLEHLKDDSETYVRRSVANNLNDISKDHPDLVTDIAHQWLVDATPERKKLVHHACRTLVKTGHRRCLEILGYGDPVVRLDRFSVLTPLVNLGETLEFELCFSSESTDSQKLVLDYIVHHMKARGSTTPKVFKWKTVTLAAGKSHQAKRKHRFKPISTRAYYPGLHGVEIILNGKSLVRAGFDLVID